MLALNPFLHTPGGLSSSANNAQDDWVLSPEPESGLSSPGETGASEFRRNLALSPEKQQEAMD